MKKTARRQAVERGAPERKKVVMHKAMKQMQLRGLREAALPLFALCLNLLLSHAHGAECCWNGGTLPCTFNGCEFSKDASGILDRTGSCPTQDGDGGMLLLENKGKTFPTFGTYPRNRVACGAVLGTREREGGLDDEGCHEWMEEKVTGLSEHVHYVRAAVTFG